VREIQVKLPRPRDQIETRGPRSGIQVLSLFAASGGQICAMICPGAHWLGFVLTVWQIAV
jgi:hypothetical protein